MYAFRISYSFTLTSMAIFTITRSSPSFFTLTHLRGIFERAENFNIYAQAVQRVGMHRISGRATLARKHLLCHN